MSNLRIWGLVILACLLFLSLSIFGPTLMLQTTLLDPQFVVNAVAEIDVPALTREVFEEEVRDQLPEEALFIEDAIYKTVDEQEAALKGQVNEAVLTGYDYLRGDTDNLKIDIDLRPLKEALRENIWQAFREYFYENYADLSADLVRPFIDEYYEEIIGGIAEEYLPPELAGLAGELLKDYLLDNLEEIIGQISLEELPPIIRALVDAQLEEYFDQYYQTIDAGIPDELAYDETTIPVQDMETIDLARQYIGYFQTGYYLVIVFLVLLVAGIVLVCREVKLTACILGSVAVIYGALTFAAVHFAGKYIPPRLPLGEVPDSLQPWLLGVFGDLISPLRTFGLAALIIGVVLLAVFFLYYRRDFAD